MRPNQRGKGAIAKKKKLCKIFGELNADIKSGHVQISVFYIDWPLRNASCFGESPPQNLWPNA